MAIEQNSGKDSFTIERNSKGHTFSVKVYFQGNGQADDTEEKMKERLKRMYNFLDQTYPKMI